MKLITNIGKDNHLQHIRKCFLNADEVVVSVAFLKSSGLVKLIKLLGQALKRKVKITFFIGTDLYLTEPQAVRELLHLKSKYLNVYLCKQANNFFHNKIYYFRYNKKVIVIVGSANFTNGGFVKNIEASLQINIEKQGIIDKKLMKLFNLYKTDKISDILNNELILSQYEKKYTIYRKKHKQAEKEAKKEIDETPLLNIDRIQKYVDEYNNSKDHRDFKNRERNYKAAKRFLNSLIRANINTPKVFLTRYEEIYSYWHSSGLLRGKTTYAKHYKKIIGVMKFIRANKDKKPQFVFSKCKGLIYNIPKYGVNAVTEIMITYNPRAFSILNGRSVKSLSGLGFQDFRAPNNFTAEDYLKFNKLVLELAQKCNFKNLAQVDDFLCYYYRRHVKNKSTANKRVCVSQE